MKSLFYIFLILIFNCINAQVDTAQIITPNRVNTMSDYKDKPYVILISADGFRSDYLEKYNAKNINYLAKQGVKADYLNPSYPSITFPNHYSIITGLYPSSHGLIDNFFYDYQRQEAYKMNDAKIVSDGTWYGGKPLWSLSEEQGLLSASLFWVSSQSDAGKTRPTYYYNYHEKFSSDQKISIVIDWLQLPEDKRPHFISLYFPEVDGAGHHFGTEAPETQKAVTLVDDAIAKLVSKTKDLGLKNVNFIFVSDHGMINVDRDNAMDIPEVLKDKQRFDFYNSQSLLRVKVKDINDLQSTYKNLKASANGRYKVYTSQNLPRRLHFRAKDDAFNRIGDLHLIPKAPQIFLEKGKKTSKGKHGYDPKIVPEMRSVFVAWGPMFKENHKVGKFNNIDVYPIVTEILDLDITSPIDGNINLPKKLFK